MDWQLGIVIIAVGAAMAYLAQATWRSWQGRKSGCGSCRCSAPANGPAGPDQSSLISTEQLTQRVRTGRPM